MLILGLESSAVSAGAALVRDGRVIGETFLNVGLTHSETLLRLTDECLKNAKMTTEDVDAFAVAAGPGSFTGVRIGISAVKGLAFGSKKPVYGVSTLEALAYGASVEDYLICPVMDARCMQVYTALFEYRGGRQERLTPDSALKLEELGALLASRGGKTLLLGDGAAMAKQYFDGHGARDIYVFPEVFRYQRASCVAFAAYMRYNNGEPGIGADQLQPGYLRPPQAQREKEKGEKRT